MRPFLLSFGPLALEFLLEFDDLMCELFNFCLVDVGEVFYVGVVEFFYGFCEFGVDVDEFFE